MTFKLIKTGALAAMLLVAPFAAAEAADMRLKAPVYKGVPRSVISYYNWTGPYGGLNVGYGTGTSEWETLWLDVKPKGMTYGVTLGYNWQAGSLVFGIEGDYNLSDMKGSATCAVGLTCQTEKPGSPPSAAASATLSTALCLTSPAAAPTATSRRPLIACRR